MSTHRGYVSTQGDRERGKNPTERVRPLPFPLDESKTMIDSKSIDQDRTLLKELAFIQPALILDVAAVLCSKQQEGQGQPPSPAQPPTSKGIPFPAWCVCHRCMKMPTDAKKVCCGM